MAVVNVVPLVPIIFVGCLFNFSRIPSLLLFYLNRNLLLLTQLSCGEEITKFCPQPRLSIDVPGWSIARILSASPRRRPRNESLHLVAAIHKRSRYQTTRQPIASICAAVGICECRWWCQTRFSVRLQTASSAGKSHGVLHPRTATSAAFMFCDNASSKTQHIRRLQWNSR